MYQEIFDNLKPEFEPKFAAVGKTYQTEFDKIYDVASNNHQGTALEEVIKLGLSTALGEYVNSTAHTKTGSILRRIGKGILKIFGYKN